MNIWFTSDTHFFHKRVLEYCPNTRPVSTVEEMNEVIITNWNNQVGDNDTVYHLGDFALCKWGKAESILKQLKGNIHLIKGNHDNSWFKLESKKYFDGVYDYLELTIKGAHVVLMHYPIAEFHRKHYGSFHIHGHSHGSFIAPGRYMDVGIDTRPNGDMKLWHWDEVYNFLSNKPY